MIPGSPGVRVTEDIEAMASFSAENKFSPGELVLVPRTGGYYTTGKIREQALNRGAQLRGGGEYNVLVGGGCIKCNIKTLDLGKLPSQLE